MQTSLYVLSDAQTLSGFKDTQFLNVTHDENASVQRGQTVHRLFEDGLEFPEIRSLFRIIVSFIVSGNSTSGFA